MADSGVTGEFGNVYQLDLICAPRYCDCFVVSALTKYLVLIIRVLWALGFASSKVNFPMLVVLTLALLAT